MKRALLLLVPCLFFIHAHAQFGGLLNKVKDKVAKKLTGQQGKKDSSSNTAIDTASLHPSGNTPGEQAGAPPGDDPTENNSPRSTRQPQPPVFEKTGKMVKTTTAYFAINTDNDWNNVLKDPMAQDFISRLRQKGLQGDDKAVLTQGMQHADQYADITAAMKTKYGDKATGIKPTPALIFSAFFSNYDYIMTNDFVRAEIDARDATTGQPSAGNTLVSAFAPGAVTLVDIKAKKTYAIANYLGIMNAAIVDDISSFQDIFGLAAYFKKYMDQPGLKLQPSGSKAFHGYHATAVRMEIPVTPMRDKDGKESNGLLYLHSLLSGNTAALMDNHYDPSYKLYLETYYTHDLDNKIPPAITSDKNILHVDGFYIGSVLKDEKGNQVEYSLVKIDPNTTIDEGMFAIPASCEKMTHEQFHQKLHAKLTGGK